MNSTTQSYTAELAYEPSRHLARTTVRYGVLPRASPLVDRYLLAPLSAFTWVGLSATLTVGNLCLIPSILFSKYVMRWPSGINLPSSGDEKTNTSNTEVGSITAIKTLSARSQASLQQSGGPDSIAPLLMSQLSLLGPNIPGGRFLTRLYSAFFRWNFYLTGRVYVDQLAATFFRKYIKFGEIGMLQTRTCWLDDVVDGFAKENASGACNVVILGAGYDTRCYRLDSIRKNGNAKLYEVDAAGSQERKRKALDKAKISASHVQFVACDFETEDWMEALQSRSDFDSSLPSVFVWEGVTYYIDREVVMATLSKVAKCGKGSCIAFDYFDASCLNRFLKKSCERIGEPMKFGVEEVDAFVAECNAELDVEDSGRCLHVLDHLRCEELKRRYVARYNGRYIGYLSEFGGFLLLGTK